MEHARTFDDMRQTMRSFEHRMDARFDAMDAKMSRGFMWLVGMQMSVVLALIALVATALRH